VVTRGPPELQRRDCSSSMSRPRTSRSRVVSRVIAPVRRDPRRCKACFPPPPRSRRQPSGRIPRVAGLSRVAGRPGKGQSGPGRTRGDVGENRLPRVTRQAYGGYGRRCPPGRRTRHGDVTAPSGAGWKAGSLFARWNASISGAMSSRRHFVPRQESHAAPLLMLASPPHGGGTGERVASVTET
jgi:hypothetical protein